MIYQYTAAALASEHKVLAHPASVDSIPTSANQEDHVSMGSIAARHARLVLEGVQRIVSIELIVAAQALDLRLASMAEGGEAPGPGAGVAEAQRRIRAMWPTSTETGSPAPILPPRTRSSGTARSSRWPGAPTAQADPADRLSGIGRPDARAGSGRTRPFASPSGSAAR